MRLHLLLVIFLHWTLASLLEEPDEVPTYMATGKMVNPASEVSDDSAAEFISLEDNAYLNEIEETDPNDSKLVLINGIIVLLSSAGFNAGLCYELMQVSDYLDINPGLVDIGLFKLVMFALLALVFDQMFGAHCVMNSRKELSNCASAPSFVLPFVKFAIDFAGFFFAAFGSDHDLSLYGPDVFFGLTVQTATVFFIASLYSIIIAVLYRK